MRAVLKLAVGITIVSLTLSFLQPSCDISVNEGGDPDGIRSMVKARLQGSRFWHRQITLIDRAIVRVERRIAILKSGPQRRAQAQAEFDSLILSIRRVEREVEVEVERNLQEHAPHLLPTPRERAARQLQRAEEVVQEKEQQHRMESFIREGEFEEIKKSEQWLSRLRKLKQTIEMRHFSNARHVEDQDLSRAPT